MTLWIRADGSPAAGYGHIMRTVAAADAAAAGQRREVRYVVTADASTVSLLARRGYGALEVASADEMGWLERVGPHDAVLFDGYSFGSRHFDAASGAGARVGALEDHDSGEFRVDVVVNQNVPVRVAYETRPDTQVLVGPRFALVRREFVACRRQRTPAARAVLVTLGASDPGGITPTVVEIVKRSRAFEHVVVLAGPAAGSIEFPGVEVVRDPPDVAAVFDGVDAVIAAAGSTTWELLCMGVPTALVQTASNQEHVGAGLAAVDAALFAAPGRDFAGSLARIVHTIADPETQLRLAATGRGLVDGRGAARVVGALVDGRPQVSVRDASESDAALLFEWANDPGTREGSFDGSPIEWENHSAWLRSRLADPAAVTLVALDCAGLPAGVIRFDRASSAWTIGVTVAPGHRGKGYGAAIITEGVGSLRDLHGPAPVDAWVKPVNEASRRAFVGAGFVPAPGAHPAGLDAIRYLSAPPTL